MVEILKGIEIIDLGLWLKKEKILIIGDLHIGFEEHLNQEGILIPRFHFNQLKEKIEKILEKVKPKLIVINGDLKHEFGTISRQEWKNTLQLLDFLKTKSKIFLIKGNHDTILKPLAERAGLKVKNYFKTGDICITHGDKIIKEVENSKIIIIGHEHPAISLTEGARKEDVKCFLAGKYKKSMLIVMPSFTLLTQGSNILKEKILSPYLKNLDDFDVYAIEDKVYKFGKVKKIKNILD